MEDRLLNSTESIALIERMISATRLKYEKGSGTSFLVFGYVSLVVAIVTTWVVQTTGNYNFTLLWWAIPLLGFTISYFATKNRPKEVKTFIDKFISQVWIIIACFLTLFPAAAAFSSFDGYMIIPIESLIISIGILITGVTIKVTPVIWSGIIAAVLSFGMLFISSGYEYIFMAMFLFGMVIPGHILNYKAKCLNN